MADEACKTWHALFDDICLARGHVDNVKLASELCDLGKSTAPGAFESALKSLGNWRQGKHTPNRRNFRLLTRILEIDGNSAWSDEWLSLYEQALRRKPGAVSPSVAVKSNVVRDETAPRAVPGRSGKAIPRYAAMASVAVIAALGVVILGEAGPVRGDDDDGRTTTLPVDMTGQQIYYREIANLRVGESIVLHGKRGPTCGEQPPEWPDVLKYLPEPNTGVWSDGGVGFRVSRACGGPTPARAVVFTATQTGVDSFRLYDDPISITVE